MPKKQTPLSEQVGRRLENLRLAKDFLKKRHFANFLEVPEDRYDKWEKGKALIPVEDAIKLKKLYGITLDWLYNGDGSTLPGNVYTELRKAG